MAGAARLAAMVSLPEGIGEATARPNSTARPAPLTRSTATPATQRASPRRTHPSRVRGNAIRRGTTGCADGLAVDRSGGVVAPASETGAW